MGVPVVIAENGFGMPVRAVEKNAPVLVVSENGFGIPIVLSDLGQPFVVTGAVPVDPVHAFTMTAGAGDLGYNGYSDGTFFPEMGAISNQPIDGETMMALIRIPESDSTALYFNSDLTGLLAGSTLVIDGVDCPLVEANWEEPFMAATYDTPGVIFEDGESYDIEIVLVP